MSERDSWIILSLIPADLYKAEAPLDSLPATVHRLIRPRTSRTQLVTKEIQTVDDASQEIATYLHQLAYVLFYVNTPYERALAVDLATELSNQKQEQKQSLPILKCIIFCKLPETMERLFTEITTESFSVILLPTYHYLLALEKEMPAYFPGAFPQE
jgi:hypothetical protein